MTPADSFSPQFSETTETLDVGLKISPPLKPLPARSPEKSRLLSAITRAEIEPSIEGKHR